MPVSLSSSSFSLFLFLSLSFISSQTLLPHLTTVKVLKTATIFGDLTSRGKLDGHWRVASTKGHSKVLCVCVCVCVCVAQLCLTLCNPMDCSLPGSPSMGFTRQEYWSRLPCPPPEDLLTQGLKLRLSHLLHWQAGSVPTKPPGKPQYGFY